MSRGRAEPPIFSPVLARGDRPLFTLQLNNLVLGNSKYGSFRRAIELNSVPPYSQPRLFAIKCFQEEVGLREGADQMCFYNIRGRFDQKKVFWVRPFAAGCQAILALRDLFSSVTTIAFNSTRRQWGLSRLSKTSTVSQELDDITAIKLIALGHLTLHAAGFVLDERAYLIMAPPDTGKSIATIEIVRGGAQFLCEDIAIAAPDGLVYGAPFTETIAKRAPKSLIPRLRGALVQSLRKINVSKETAVDAGLVGKENLASGARAAAVFLLKRGDAQTIRALQGEERKAALRTLLMLQRFEFSYAYNPLVLGYLFFNSTHGCIDDFIQREREYLEAFLAGVDIIEVVGPGPLAYAPLIKKFLKAKGLF